VATKKKKFDANKEVRAIARERIGKIPSGRTILPKSERKPKHKKVVDEEESTT
jgi:hypothetical protein